MLTTDDIREVLQKNDIVGKSISIHSSYKSFGKVDGGPKAIIKAFLDEGNTLLVPTFSYSYMREPVEQYSPINNAWDYEEEDEYGENSNNIFKTDSNNIDNNMGIIPKLLLNMANRVRGYNPLDSFTAIGNSSKDLISGQTTIDVYEPFKNLLDDDGLIILMGVSYDRMTLIHHCEKEFGRNMFIRWALGSDGETIPVETGGCSSGFINMTNELDKLAINIKVGLSEWKIFRARDVDQAVISILKRDSKVTKCDDINCIFCRDSNLGGPSYE